MDESVLRSIPLFSALSRDELRWLSAHTDEVPVEAGDRLIRDGAFAHEFFVILDGTAAVTRGGEHVADLVPGDFMGEMGVLAEEGRRSATVVATSPMRVVVMTDRDLRDLRREVPSVADAVARAVKERMGG